MTKPNHSHLSLNLPQFNGHSKKRTIVRGVNHDKTTVRKRGQSKTVSNVRGKFTLLGLLLKTATPERLIQYATGQNHEVPEVIATQFLKLNMPPPESLSRYDVPLIQIALNPLLLVSGDTDSHVEKRAFKIAELLINSGHDVNALSPSGLPILHSSIIANRVKVVKFLLKHDARVEQKIGANGKLNGLDALTLVYLIQKQNPDIDYSEVIIELQSREKE